MYQPDHFRVEDVPQMHKLIRGRPFAALVSAGSLGLYASHLPTVLKEEGPYGVIECHLARANPHCKELGAVAEAMMIFQGPEGYITPNWYPTKAQSGKVVPTWNYAVVHAYGRPEVMTDPAWLRRHVGELTDQQERTESGPWSPQPWAVSDAPETYIQAMLRGIVGFRFAITRLEGKWKMSQNREMQDREGVVQGLGRRNRGDDPAIADYVAAQIKPRD
jgi:transcriptional regulator